MKIAPPTARPNAKVNTALIRPLSDSGDLSSIRGSRFTSILSWAVSGCELYAKLAGALEVIARLVRFLISRHSKVDCSGSDVGREEVIACIR